MSTWSVTYHRPTRVAEACELARELGHEARFIAGGTEIVSRFAAGKDAARHLIALDALGELRAILREGDELRIGALATITEVAESSLVNELYPPLVEAARWLGNVQIRNQATIGGNFCGAVPCADTPPICIVARGSVRLASAEGERQLTAEEFFVGPRESALRAGELLAAIAIPAQPAAAGARYERFGMRRGSAVAVAAVAARVVLAGGRISEARVALGAVAPVPLLASSCSRLLEGQPPSAQLFAQAGEAAAAEARPISDIRGSAEFRRAIVRTLTARALTRAASRAGADMGADSEGGSA
ncbi:MAG: FAD binding domain-containing protein [Acidobacteriota bacterium]|nr:MAG: FAD binding domain-containing protein [Acidobacteriota bacterium]